VKRKNYRDANAKMVEQEGSEIKDSTALVTKGAVAGANKRRVKGLSAMKHPHV
jgi:hypothetical protein